MTTDCKLFRKYGWPNYKNRPLQYGYLLKWSIIRLKIWLILRVTTTILSFWERRTQFIMHQWHLLYLQIFRITLGISFIYWGFDSQITCYSCFSWGSLDFFWDYYWKLGSQSSIFLQVCYPRYDCRKLICNVIRFKSMF